MTSAWCHYDVIKLGHKVSKFLQNGTFWTLFFMRETSIKQKMFMCSLKQNHLNFQKMYLKIWLSLILTEISRDKDKRFFIQNDQNGGKLNSGPEAPVDSGSSVIIAKGWNCVIGYVKIFISKMLPVIQKVKNCQKSKIS